jgi:hypothetical protein
MIDSLAYISVSTQHLLKDTIYVINLNSESEFLKILPIMIAGIALLFTTYSIVISRRTLMSNIQHQKLSVQPLLNSFEDFTFRDNEGIGIKLINCGLGPAIIQNFNLLWDGNEINEKNYNKIYDALLIHNIELGKYFKDGIIEKDAIKWIFRVPLTELPVDRTRIIRGNEISEIIKKSLVMQ